MTFRFEDTKSIPQSIELLADLRSVAAKVGRDHIAQNEYRKLGQYSSTVMKKRFGSWNKALEAAGLATVTRQSTSKAALTENLLEVWTALGRQPRKGEMRAPISRFTHHPYIRQYGSWLVAMKQFTEFANSEALQVAAEEPAPVDTRGPRIPSLRLRFRVLVRDGFRCRVCGRSPALEAGVLLHIDHITAWAAGGSTTLDNLQTLCDRCNLGKSDEPITEIGA